MKFKTFALATSIGAYSLFFILSIVGNDITAILNSLLKLSMIIAVGISVSIIGKIIEKRLIIRG